MRKCVAIFYSCLLATGGCAHREVSQDETPLALNSPMKFEISGEKGYREKQKYFYSSHQKTYEGKQIAHERSENTEFAVENEIISVSKDPRYIEVKQKTIEKSGPADLEQMAFPELNETLAFRYNPWGDVLKAGDKPPFSIFFVSPVPLPQRPIQVGDTWEYKGSWIDYNQGIEMNVNLIGVLRETISCYDNEICLNLEYSGNVELPEKLQKAAKFKGKVLAKFILRPKNFSVLRSEIYNTEYLARDDFTMDIKSCIVSKIASSKELLTCTP